MVYKNYKKLKNMKFYQFVDSEGKVGLYRFDGYYYCDDWYEDAIILYDPETGMFEWPSCEFQFALDPEDDPKEYLEEWECGWFL